MGEMELILTICVVVLFVLSYLQHERQKILKQLYISDTKHIETLYYRTNELQKSVSKLGQRKQSEIRANYNMDFTRINTDM
jgi:predicted Holliday junction resolvase-like endonuclease